MTMKWVSSVASVVDTVLPSFGARRSVRWEALARLSDTEHSRLREWWTYPSALPPSLCPLPTPCTTCLSP